MLMMMMKTTDVRMVKGQAYQDNGHLQLGLVKEHKEIGAVANGR